MRTFEQFKNNEMDPYGEEDWNDEVVIGIGDIVKLINNKSAHLLGGLLNGVFIDADDIEIGDVGMARMSPARTLGGETVILVDFDKMSGWFNSSCLKRLGWGGAG